MTYYPLTLLIFDQFCCCCLSSWLYWVFVAARTSYSGGEWGLLFLAGCRLLIVVASLVAEHGLSGTWASVVAAPRPSRCSQTLVAPRHMGSPRVRDWTHFSCTDRQTAVYSTFTSHLVCFQIKLLLLLLINTN